MPTCMTFPVITRGDQPSHDFQDRCIKEIRKRCILTIHLVFEGLSFLLEVGYRPRVVVHATHHNRVMWQQKGRRLHDKRLAICFEHFEKYLRRER